MRVRSAAAGATARDDRRWRHTYRGWRDDPDEQAIHHIYLGKLTEFGVWLIERGYRIRLLTGGTRDGVAVLATRVEAGWDPLTKSVIKAAPARSLDDLMRATAETSMVAARFHNIVCVMKLCRPSRLASLRRATC